jgi:hypothetical protein
VTTMTSIRQAIQTVELSEREMAPLLLGAHPGAGLAVLGSLMGRVVREMVNDRRLLKSWLSQTPEITV